MESRVVFDAIDQRIQPHHSRLRWQLEICETDSETFTRLAPRSEHPDVSLPQLISNFRWRIRAHFGEPYEVAIGIEDDQGQLGLQQHLLEQHAKHVRLARTALTAPEGVPVQTARNQPGWKI